MRLASFLEQAQAEILEEAVAFARTLAPLAHVEVLLIRDYLAKIVQAIAADLREGQSHAASIAKSHGKTTSAAIATDADAHGKQRAQVGLNIEQLLAEYRALRASVLRLWSQSTPMETAALWDISRFNEAIDQAIAESVRGFAAESELQRQLFLATLGHDLRGPLNAVSLTAQVITAQVAAAPACPMLVKSTQLLSRSAARMSQLLDSLLTVNVAGLGGKMALGRSEVDLATECEEELQIQRAAFPSARIEMAVEGPCQGHFDASRIREALSNLVSNAVQHGLAHEPVQIALQGDAIQVRLSVSNGVDKPLSSGELELLFEPMRRREQGPLGGDRAHLGLGLFISREIARAHGGGIAGQCAGHKIIFTLWVPRQSSR